MVNAYAQLIHNGNVVCEAERMLNDALSKGSYLWIENPDGTIIRLQNGFTIKNVEFVGINIKI